MKKRIIAFLLAALMVASLLPMTVFAKAASTITLNLNGGTISNDTSKTELTIKLNKNNKVADTGKYEGNNGKLPKEQYYVREGYTFAGFSQNKNCQAKNAVKFDKFLNKELDNGDTWYVIWKIQEYVLSYDVNGGKISKKPSYTKAGKHGVGSTIKTPSATKTGYTLDGWYYMDGSTEKKWTSGDPMPAHDLSLYAKWTANEYTLVYNTLGLGRVDRSTDTVTYDGNYPDPLAEFTPLDPYHAAFEGWYHGLTRIVPGATVKEVPLMGSKLELLPKIGLRVIAAWFNEDELLSFVSVEPGSEVAYEGETPTKESDLEYDYTFEGWAPSVNKVYLDTAFFAQYSKSLHPYTLTFYPGEGEFSGSRTQTRYYHETFTEPEDPVYGGYDFLGWFEEGETAPYDFDTPVESDVVLYAKYAQDTFTAFLPYIGGELPFTDVSFYNWFYDAVVELYENGIMNGVSYDRFDPFGTLTRGMVATMLWRLDGMNVAPVSPFTDVARDKWYADAVDWAYASGVVKGVSETEFAPEAPVTNEQLFTMLARYAQYVGLNVYTGNVLTGYADADAVSDWAYDSVCFAADWNMIYTEDGFLHPDAPATRAQAAYAFAALCD